MMLRYRYRSRRRHFDDSVEVILPWRADFRRDVQERMEHALVLLTASRIVGQQHAQLHPAARALLGGMVDATRVVLCSLAKKLTWGAA